MEEASAKTISDIAKTPGVICEISINQLPKNLQNMPGLVSCFVSGDINPHILEHGITIGTEFVMLRSEGKTGKAYNFALAISSDGKFYFSDPYTKFSNHHFDPKIPMRIENFFGHTPFFKKTNE
jgi:hypothetical protein